MSEVESIDFNDVYKCINIKTVDGSIYNFPFSNIFSYDFDFTKELLRIDFKDGSFIEFIKKNLIFYSVIDERKGGI